jgi:hypothetical protein
VATGAKAIKAERSTGTGEVPVEPEEVGEGGRHGW